MKKVIITTTGFIEPKGVFGPVLSPYMETDKEIMKMLARGIEVKEVLANGELYKLSVSDLNKRKEHTNKPVKTSVKTETVNNVKPYETATYSNRQQSKKEKKKNKQKQNQNLGFEIDVLESK